MTDEDVAKLVERLEKAWGAECALGGAPQYAALFREAAAALTALRGELALAQAGLFKRESLVRDLREEVRNAHKEGYFAVIADSEDYDHDAE